MNKKPALISLKNQINKAIGYRIVICSVLLMFVIIGITTYDLFNSFKQLKAQVDERKRAINLI